MKDNKSKYFTILILILFFASLITTFLTLSSRNVKAGEYVCGGKIIYCDHPIIEDTCSCVNCPTGKVWDSSTNKCVDCLTSSDCSGSTPKCYEGKCVECSKDSDCSVGKRCSSDGNCVSCEVGDTSCHCPSDKPVWDETSGSCKSSGGSCGGYRKPCCSNAPNCNGNLECISDNSGGKTCECPSSAPVWDSANKRCVGCLSDNDCKNNPNKKNCDTKTHECVSSGGGCGGIGESCCSGDTCNSGFCNTTSKTCENCPSSSSLDCDYHFTEGNCNVWGSHCGSGSCNTVTHTCSGGGDNGGGGNGGNGDGVKTSITKCNAGSCSDVDGCTCNFAHANASNVNNGGSCSCASDYSCNTTSGECVPSCTPSCPSSGSVCADTTFTGPNGCGGSCSVVGSLSCDDNNPCTVDSCSDGQCSHSNKADGTSCGVGEFCEKGVCKQGVKKLTWDGKVGYCLHSDECLLDPNGNFSKSNIFEWFKNGGSDEPMCVPSGSFVFDHYCENGNWSSRLGFLADVLVNFSVSKLHSNHYSLICGNFSDVVPYLVGVSTNLIGKDCSFGRASASKSFSCLGKVCVLRDYDNGGSTLLGVPLFWNLSVPFSYLGDVLNLSNTNCGRVWSDNINKKGWFPCAYKEVWLNPKRGLLVFSPSGVNFVGANFWSDPFVVIIEFLKSLFVRRNNYSNAPIQLSPYLSSSFDSVYLLRSGVHRVVGVLNGSGLFVDFAGFCSNVSSFLPRGGGVVSFGNVSRHNFVFGVNGDSASAVWPLVSGGLRIGGKGCECSPLNKSVVCSGLDCGFVGDGCGGFVDCGSCGSGGVCSGNHCCPSATPVWNGSACVSGGDDVRTIITKCGVSCSDVDGCKCSFAHANMSIVFEGISCSCASGYSCNMTSGECVVSGGSCGGYDQSCCSSGVACDVSEGLVCNSSSVCSCNVSAGMVWNSTQKKCVVGPGGNCVNLSLVWNSPEVSFENSYVDDVSVAALNSSYFVVAYANDSHVTRGFVRVGHFNGSTVVWDASKELSSYSVDISVAALNSSCFVVSYVDPPMGFTGRVDVGCFDGSSITWKDYYETVDHNILGIHVASLGSGYFAVVYSGFEGAGTHSGSGQRLYQYIVNVKVGRPSNFGVDWITNRTLYQDYASLDIPDDNSCVAVAGLGSGRFVDLYHSLSKTVVYNREHSIKYDVVGAGSFDGSELSLGGSNSLQDAYSSYASVASLGSSDFVVAYNTLNQDIVGVGSFSDAKLVNTSVFSKMNISGLSVAGLGSKYFLIGFVGRKDSFSSVNLGRVILGSYDGSSLNLSAPLPLGNDNLNSVSVAPLDSSHFVVAYGGDNGGNVRVGSLHVTHVPCKSKNSCPSGKECICCGDICDRISSVCTGPVCKPGDETLSQPLSNYKTCDKNCSVYGPEFKGYCVPSLSGNLPSVCSKGQSLSGGVCSSGSDCCSYYMDSSGYHFGAGTCYYNPQCSGGKCSYSTENCQAGWSCGPNGCTSGVSS